MLPHIEVGKRREDLDEVRLPLCGPFVDSQDTKDTVFLHLLNICNSWEVKSVLQENRLHPKEVYPEAVLIQDGHNFPHIVNIQHLATPPTLHRQLNEDKVIRLENTKKKDGNQYTVKLCFELKINEISSVN